MEIKGKVHCFFEQSGTFKNEFIKLGIPAEDYDIQNNFGQTDHTEDLFQAIDDAWEGKPSLFDGITKDDLILAFFPCIYFCSASESYYNFNNLNYRCKTQREKALYMIERGGRKYEFWARLIKFMVYCETNSLRLIVENPASGTHYLTLSCQFPYKPAYVDKDRSLRGDFFKKPTMYFFVNCSPGLGFTKQPNLNPKAVYGAKGSGQAGLCSEERSMISPTYAHNFINDQILGKVDFLKRPKLPAPKV
jgi:hypothetical protein